MTTINGKNVNELWARGLHTLKTFGIESDSRAGRVLVMQTPVTSVYRNSCERVLMDPLRDANPFFHLMESLWMLAGRDDSKFLNRYVQDFGARFAEHADDPGAYIHGAYGWRWREAMGFDQLDAVVEKLRANPDDRQAVIQMWDASAMVGRDCGAGRDDLLGTWKDRPCNTHVYLRVRTVGIADEQRRVLDLTVLCRSNDVVWGAYGANAVHFSVLQEYLAGRIGVDVGVMYQFSNNYHGYVSVLSKYSTSTQQPGEPWNNPYEVAGLEALPMGTSWDKWDDDLTLFMDWHDKELWGDIAGSTEPVIYANSWFPTVAVPVALANKMWKHGAHDEALIIADGIAASDWRFACIEWMHRRTK